jgi:imidazolonepropionase-like amidohydrolase
MNRCAVFVILFILIATGLRAGESPQLVLHNVTIIDGSGRPPAPPGDLLIEGERIAAIRPAGMSWPEGTEIIDLTGRYLIPGLIDMHAHLLLHPWKEDGSIAARWDRESLLEILRLFLRFGVTTVRDPGSETESAVTLRAMLARGDVEGPELITAGRMLNSASFDPEPFIVVTAAAAVREEIEWQHRAGVDLIKVYSSMPAELTAVAIREAHARGLPVIGHLQRTTWKEAALLGIDSLEHAAPWTTDLLPEERRATPDRGFMTRVWWLENIELESTAVRDTIDTLVRNGTSVTPTLMAMHTKLLGNDPRWLTNPDNLLMPELHRRGWPAGHYTRNWSAAETARGRDAWPRLAAWTRRLHEAGVVLTVGTDTPTPWIVPGASVHDEMELLAGSGIPPLEVIRMATSNAARVLGRDDIGLIEPGRRADLVILAADPTTDIRNSRSIEMVVQRGRILEPPPEPAAEPNEG